MRRLHLLVEGQTEEIVARDVIASRFTDPDVWTTFSIYKTKRPAGGPAHKGGLSHWAKLRQELRLLLQDSSITVLSTLFDYYAFPEDAPGMTDRLNGTPYDRVAHVERALLAAIDDKRFLPHLVLHEMETWVLADCPRLGEVMGDSEAPDGLSEVVREEGGPELVDDGVHTAPSKRILNAYTPDTARPSTVRWSLLTRDLTPSGSRVRTLTVG